MKLPPRCYENSIITDASLRVLSNFKSLQILHISLCNSITSWDCLKPLSAMDSLGELLVINCVTKDKYSKTTGGGFPKLPNLRKLTIVRAGGSRFSFQHFLLDWTSCGDLLPRLEEVALQDPSYDSVGGSMSKFEEFEESRALKRGCFKESLMRCWRSHSPLLSKVKLHAPSEDFDEEKKRVAIQKRFAPTQIVFEESSFV